MALRHFAAVLLAVSVSLGTGGSARADGGDIAGGIIGGVIGGVIVNEAIKSREAKKVYRQPVETASRAANREVQTALNYFGFPAGTPDGVFGQRTRTAVSQYQAHLGYPVTGALSDYEKDFLIGSYHRALAGGAATNQQIASNPMGTRGLLLVYRDEAAGIAAPVQAAAPAQGAGAAAGQIAALPNFLGGGGGRSLASHCNTVSLLTNTNGGFTKIDAMTDPDAVLNEQFCLARTYAIAAGEGLAAGVQGVGAAEIAAQCQAFGPVMKAHVAALSLKPMEAVLQDVSGFVLSTGMGPLQLAATSEICLSVGYRTDDMDVAIGSALILAALGEPVYGELIGHHLGQGFGAAPRRDLAAEWYGMALDALEAGYPAAFAPGQPERVVLLRAAVGGGQAETMGAPLQPASALPNFQVIK